MRHIIKAANPNGVPTMWEIADFEQRKGVSINEVNRLYVTFKVGKRRKIKRLRITKKTYPCELCGSHSYAHGSVGSKEFDLELF
jgi:hypothetical protein